MNFPRNTDITVVGAGATSVGDALAFVMNRNLRVVSPEGAVLHSFDMPSNSIAPGETLYLIQYQGHYMRGVPTNNVLSLSLDSNSSSSSLSFSSKSSFGQKKKKKKKK